MILRQGCTLPRGDCVGQVRLGAADLVGARVQERRLLQREFGREGQLAVGGQAVQPAVGGPEGGMLWGEGC